MFVAVHKDKHYVGGSSRGKEFIVTKGYHIPYSCMGYLSGVLYVTLMSSITHCKCNAYRVDVIIYSVYICKIYGNNAIVLIHKNAVNDII